jgi:3-dehydroquinate dehydratase type I
MPKTVEEAKPLIDKAEEAGVDLIETRLDRFGEFEHLAEVASRGKIPKIATLKLLSQGGRFTGPEPQQRDILINAAKSGFAYIDIDLKATNPRKFATETREQGARIIISSHNFNKTPKSAQLSRILNEEIKCGAEVCKIVTTASQIEDNLVLLNFLAANSHKARVVCFGMGEAGKVSRLMSPIFGAYFTFASLERGAETAAGQMTIDEMKASYKLLGF